MRGTRTCPRVAALCLTGFLVVGIGWAQRTTGSLGGTVVDETGGVIPGVEVNVINQQTGVVRSALTNDEGVFVAASLTPGQYTVRIEMPGFRTFEQRDVRVDSARDVRQTFTLQVGEVTETVTVSGSSVLVNTVSSEQRVGVAEEQVRQLPMRNRNITGLLVLNPAVTSSTEQGGTGHRGLRLSGLGRNSAMYTMDGVEASGSPQGNTIGQYGGTNRVDMLSAEAVQDVQILKGVLPAEYGLAAAGQVNVVSKSGTREFHGSVFELYQTQALNARDPFLAEKPKLVYNQFGGSLGGPMLPGGGVGAVEDAFFFFALEGYEERRGVREQEDVPTQLARDLALASPDFTDREKQILQTVFDPVPLPNVPGTVDERGLGGLFLTARSAPAEDLTWTAKWDVHLRDDNGHLAVTWNRLDPSLVDTRIVSAGDRVWADNNNRFAVSYDLNRGPFIFESRFGVQILEQERLDRFFDVRDPTQPNEEFFAARRLPTLEVSGGGVEFETLPGEIWINNATTYNVDQKIGYITGNHFIKFGGSFRHKSGNRQNPEVPNFEFDSFEDFLANRPSELSSSFGEPANDSRTFQFGFFIQDDWRVTPRLSLNLGFRYDFISDFQTASIDQTPVGNLPRVVNLVPPTNWPAFNFGGFLPNPIEHDPVNFAPRFGFNYDVLGDGRMRLKGGYGIMFMDLNKGLFEDTIAGTSLPFRQIFRGAELEELGVRLGTLNAQAAEITRALRGGLLPLPNAAFDPNVDAPYAQHFTLGLETQVGSGYVWEIDYVGTRTVKFPLVRVPNEPDRLTSIRPNPDLLLNFYTDNSNTGIYNGLQTRFQSDFTGGLAFSLNYAWGRSSAIGANDVGSRFASDLTVAFQDFFRTDLERSRTPGDVAHNFAANWLWEIPSPPGLGGTGRQVLGGWTITGTTIFQTGSPLTVSQRSGGRVAQRPDLAPGFDLEGTRLEGDFGSTLEFFNPDAFVVVPNSEAGVPVRAGNLGRNFISGPGFWTVDFSFGKSFFLGGEDTRLTFRWDLLNAFNNFSPSGPRSNLTASRFGRIEGQNGQSRVSQLMLKLDF